MSIFNTIGNALGSFGQGLFNTLTGGLLNIGGNMMQSQYNTKQSKELMKYQSELQREQQEFLMHNQIPFAISSMKQAGINPALQNGVSAGGLSAPLPNASANPVQSNSFDVAGAMQAAAVSRANEANIELAKSQSDYYKSLAGKTRTETDLLDAQNLTFFERFNVEMDNLISQSMSNRAGTGLMEQQKEQVRQATENLKTEQSKMLSEIANNDAFLKLKKKEIEYYDAYIKSAIAQNFANAKLMSGRDSREGQELMYKLFNYSAVTSYYDNQAELLKANKDIADWSLRMSKKYGDAQNWINMGSQIVNSVVGTVSAVKGFGFAPYTISSNSGPQLGPLSRNVNKHVFETLQDYNDFNKRTSIKHILNK